MTPWFRGAEIGISKGHLVGACVPYCPAHPDVVRNLKRYFMTVPGRGHPGMRTFSNSLPETPLMVMSLV